MDAEHAYQLAARELPAPETAPNRTRSHRGCDSSTSPLHSYTLC